MPVARRAPRAGRLAATAGTVAVVAVFYVLSYGDATGTFFSADDYWVMADAADVHMRGPLDVVQFFVPGHNGFALYRPLSTVAYFYVLHGLFGYDPAGYHAAQLTLNVIDAALLYAIAAHVLDSSFLGLATALLYAAAPGSALAAYWVALCTVTGTACLYFVAVYLWVRHGWRVGVVPVFLLALAAAEHAVTLPVTLTLAVVLLDGRWPNRADLRALLPLWVVAAGYTLAKLIYMRTSAIGVWYAALPGGYAISWDPVRWLENLGRYAGYAAPILYRAVAPREESSRAVAIAVGAVLAVAAIGLCVAARPGQPASRTVRVTAFGLASFPVMLGPVLLLGTHLYGYYVGIAALGLALATIAGLAAIPRVGMVAVTACVVASLTVHATVNATAVRDEGDFVFFRTFTRAAVHWLYNVERVAREQPAARQIVLKESWTTSQIFDTGAYRLLLPGTDVAVRLVPDPATVTATPDTVVMVWPTYQVPADHPMPGASPRWNWLRAKPPSARPPS